MDFSLSLARKSIGEFYVADRIFFSSFVSFDQPRFIDIDGGKTASKRDLKDKVREKERSSAIDSMQRGTKRR